MIDNVLVLSKLDLGLKTYEYLLISMLREHNTIKIQTKNHISYDILARTLIERIDFFVRLKEVKKNIKITPRGKNYELICNEYIIERAPAIQDEKLNHGT